MKNFRISRKFLGQGCEMWIYKAGWFKNKLSIVQEVPFVVKSSYTKRCDDI